MPEGTLRAILKQAAIDPDSFLAARYSPNPEQSSVRVSRDHRESSQNEYPCIDRSLFLRNLGPVISPRVPTDTEPDDFRMRRST